MIECPDNEDRDTGDSKENDDNTDSEFRRSHVNRTISIRPSREVAVKAREKMRCTWLEMKRMILGLGVSLIERSKHNKPFKTF